MVDMPAPPPEPGTLYLLRHHANPNGAPDAELYVFHGNASTRPITRVKSMVERDLRHCALPSDRPTRIKLIHFNDLHGHVACFSLPEPLPVFSRMVSYLRGTRGRYLDDPNTLVLAISGGDDFGGAIFDELLGSDLKSYIVHAGYRLYSEAGIDIGVLGNHDFDKGLSILRHAIERDARFPLLAANCQFLTSFDDMVFPAAILCSKGIRVGFLGLTTPAQLHPEVIDEIRITDPITVARNLIPAIRPYCDVLIILSHLGYSLETDSAAVLMAGDLELADALSSQDVQLIIGAHTHTVVNEKGLSASNIINDIPIVQAGKMGQYIGAVDLTIHRGVTVTHARLTATADLPVDRAFEMNHIRPLLVLAEPFWYRVLGRVAVDETISTDVVRNEFAAGESSLANFITDALVFQSQEHGYDVDFAMIDASNVRTGLLSGGTVTYGDWFDLMPFADTLCLIRLTGHQIHHLLDDNAMRVDRPFKPHLERGFLHFSRQVRYTIDLGQDRVTAKAVDAEILGIPLAHCLDRRFTIATTSFVRGMAGAWELHQQRKLTSPLFDLSRMDRIATHLYIRQMMVDYITRHHGVTTEAGARRDGRLQIVIPAERPASSTDKADSDPTQHSTEENR